MWGMLNWSQKLKSSFLTWLKWSISSKAYQMAQIVLTIQIDQLKIIIVQVKYFKSSSLSEVVQVKKLKWCSLRKEGQVKYFNSFTWLTTWV